MSATDVLKEVEDCGAHMGLEGDRIYVEPVSAVPRPLLIELRRRKSELLGLLGDRVGDSLGGAVAASSVTDSEVCAMPLSEFAEARLVVEVSSRVLGETVVFASDNAVLDPGERRTVYRAAELRALTDLASLDPEELRQIHRVKRTFKGSILG